MKRVNGGSKGLYAFKLSISLIFLTFTVTSVPTNLGGVRPIWAQETGVSTSVFEFDLDSARRVRLERRAAGWELRDSRLDESVTSMAFEEFRFLGSLASAQKTSSVRRASLADLILNLNPRSTPLLSPSNPKDRQRTEFIEAWTDYRLRFSREFEQLQSELSNATSSGTAAIYFAEQVIRGGVRAALLDPKVQDTIQSLLKDLSEKLSKTQTMAINDEFSFRISKKKITNRIQGIAKVTPLWDPQNITLNTEVSEPSEVQTTSENGNIVFGKIRFAIPLKGFRVALPQFQLNSSALDQPFVVQARDEFELEFSVDQNQPVQGEFLVVWNSITNMPDLVINRSDLRTHFETLALKQMKYQSKIFEASNQKFSEWLAQDGWGPLYQVLTDSKFADTWLGKAKAEIQTQLSEFTSIEKNINVFMKSGPLKIDERGVAENPYQIETADPARPLSEEAQRSRVASFHLRVDFKLSLDRLDPQISSKTAAARPYVRVRVSDPRARISDLQVYFRGAPLSLHDLGLDVSLVSNGSAQVQADVSGSFVWNGETQIGPIQAATNFEILGIDQFRIRLGQSILETRAPGVQQLMQYAEFLRAKLVSRDPYKKQPRLGVDLQTAIVGELQTQFSSRLSNTQIQVGPLYDDDGKVVRSGRELLQNMDVWKLKLQARIQGQEGHFEFPRMRLQNIAMHFTDQSRSNPVCKGTYLISGETQLGISDPMVIRGKNLKFGITTTIANVSRTMNVTARDVLAQVHQLDGSHSELNLSFDICYLDGQESLDIRLRNHSHNLDKIVFEDLDVHGVEVDSGWLNNLSGILGYGSMQSTSRDEKISRLFQDILIQQQEFISASIASELQNFFGKIIPKFLNSAEIKEPLEQGIARLDQAAYEATQYAAQVGVHLKVPVELAINEAIRSFTNKKMVPLIGREFDGRRETLDQSVVHLGRWLGADIEELLYVKIIESLYGRTSRRALSVNLERMLTPLASQRALKRDFRLFDESSADEPIREIRRSIQWSSILSSLDACPFENSEMSLRKVSESMNQLQSAVDEDTQEAILKFLKQRCDPRDENFTLGLSGLKELYGRGLINLNELLVSEAVRKYTTIPGSKQAPFYHGPQSSIDETQMLRAHGFEPGFETIWTVSKIELLKNPARVFRVTLKSPQFSNSWVDFSAEVPPPVLNALSKSDQNFILEVPRATLNQMLMKIDWAKVIQNQIGVDYRVDIPGVPQLNELNEFEFTARVDTTLAGIVGVGAQLSGSIPVKLRLMNSENGAGVQVFFSKFHLDQLDAGALVAPIVRSKVADLNVKLERGLNLALSQLGSLPKVAWLSNGFQIDDLLIDRGYFYLTAKRFDWPGESKLALKR